jgi:hypothetical protein
MTSIDLKHIHTFRDRHGKLRTYARVPGQKAVALPGIPGSAEYMSDANVENTHVIQIFTNSPWLLHIQAPTFSSRTLADAHG